MKHTVRMNNDVVSLVNGRKAYLRSYSDDKAWLLDREEDRFYVYDFYDQKFLEDPLSQGPRAKVLCFGVGFEKHSEPKVLSFEELWKGDYHDWVSRFQRLADASQDYLSMVRMYQSYNRCPVATAEQSALVAMLLESKVDYSRVTQLYRQVAKDYNQGHANSPIEESLKFQTEGQRGTRVLNCESGEVERLYSVLNDLLPTRY